MYSCKVHADELRKNKVQAIILSGGPYSVYDDNAPHVDPSVWTFIEELNIPVLGINMKLQLIIYQ